MPESVNIDLTARVAAESGHEVVVYERNQVAGGQVRTAAAGPTRELLLDFIHYLEGEVRRLGAEIRFGTNATSTAILSDRPDLAVIATGATPLPPPFPVDSDAQVITVWLLYLSYRTWTSREQAACATAFQ